MVKISCSPPDCLYTVLRMLNEWKYFHCLMMFFLWRCWPLTPPVMWTPWWWSTGRCLMTTRRLSRTNCRWRWLTQSRVNSTRVRDQDTCPVSRSHVTCITRARNIIRISLGEDLDPLHWPGMSRMPPRDSSRTWSLCRKRAETTHSGQFKSCFCNLDMGVP